MSFVRPIPKHIQMMCIITRFLVFSFKWPDHNKAFLISTSRLGHSNGITNGCKIIISSSCGQLRTLYTISTLNDCDCIPLNIVWLFLHRHWTLHLRVRFSFFSFMHPMCKIYTIYKGNFFLFSCFASLGLVLNNVSDWTRKECMIDYDFISNGGSNAFWFNIFDMRNNGNWKLNEKFMDQKADIDSNIT